MTYEQIRSKAAERGERAARIQYLVSLLMTNTKTAQPSVKAVSATRRD